MPYAVLLLFFLGNATAVNGSLLPAFFASLYAFNTTPTNTTPTNSTPTITTGPPSLEEHIWWIVGALGGATVALFLILFILVVAYVTVKQRRQVAATLLSICDSMELINVLYT